MKKYVIGSLSMLGRAEIKEEEVERETESSVWINGRRAPKHCAWHNYFDTWDEAHAALMSAADRAVISAESTLQRSQMNRDRIAAMRKP